MARIFSEIISKGTEWFVSFLLQSHFQRFLRPCFTMPWKPHPRDSAHASTWQEHALVTAVSWCYTQQIYTKNSICHRRGKKFLDHPVDQCMSGMSRDGKCSFRMVATPLQDVQENLYTVIWCFFWPCITALHRHTVRLFTEGDVTRDCGDTICPPEDEQRAARNMLRIVV